MSRYFKALNYTLGDEDTRLELALLPERARQVVAIAGSGGRILPLLAKRPQRLACVDILPQQLSLLRLRLALLGTHDHATFLEFLGYREGMTPAQRRGLFDDLRLGVADREFLAGAFGAIGWGRIVYQGRFERMLRTLHGIVRIATGEAGRGIFETADLDEQRRYYRTRFPHRRWKAVVAVLGNSAVLNSLLYAGDFPRNNLGISAFARYEEIFGHLFEHLPVRESFFLQQIFLGRVVHDVGLPVECDPQIYAAAKAALLDCDVQAIHVDAIEYAASREDVDFVSISDVPSFLPDDRAASFLQEMRSALSPGALVVSRGHMRVAHPRLDGYEDVSAAHADLIAGERTGLWKVNVYRRLAI